MTKYNFYFRCVSCNMQLDEFQQKTGLCTECRDVVKQANDPYQFEVSEYEIYRMWYPPMGSMDEFFQDVENEYNGGIGGE